MSTHAPSWIADTLNPDWMNAPARPHIEQMMPDLLLHAGVSNNYALKTGVGPLIVDPGHALTSRSFYDGVRGWRNDPLHTVTYTHGSSGDTHPNSPESALRAISPPTLQFESLDPDSQAFR